MPQMSKGGIRLALPSPSRARTVLEARDWTHIQMYAEDWPPYAYQNSTTMELAGIGKDIADGLTASCSRGGSDYLARLLDCRRLPSNPAPPR